jgi:hypothetical protein
LLYPPDLNIEADIPNGPSADTVTKPSTKMPKISIFLFRAASTPVMAAVIAPKCSSGGECLSSAQARSTSGRKKPTLHPKLLQPKD